MTRPIFYGRPELHAGLGDAFMLGVCAFTALNHHSPVTDLLSQTMPRHESAKKRMRQNKKRHERNKSQKSRVRTKIKKLHSLDDQEEAEELLNDVKGDLDRLAAKGVIHKNKAANRKSTLEKHVDALE